SVSTPPGNRPRTEGASMIASGLSVIPHPPCRPFLTPLPPVAPCPYVVAARTARRARSAAPSRPRLPPRARPRPHRLSYLLQQPLDLEGLEEDALQALLARPDDR